MEGCALQSVDQENRDVWSSETMNRLTRDSAGEPKVLGLWPRSRSGWKPRGPPPARLYSCHEGPVAFRHSFRRPRRMAFFHRVRMLTWPRALLVGLVLAFALNGVAHAAHQHDDNSPTSSLHSTVCGYCVSFDHLTSTPTLVAPALAIDVELFAIPLSDRPAPTLRPRATAQPRAPPLA
jgi:hypothetical protein